MFPAQYRDHCRRMLPSGTSTEPGTIFLPYLALAKAGGTHSLSENWMPGFPKKGNAWRNMASIGTWRWTSQPLLFINLLHFPGATTWKAGRPW